MITVAQALEPAPITPARQHAAETSGAGLDGRST
jgi:hypothetical protein